MKMRIEACEPKVRGCTFSCDTDLRTLAYPDVGLGTTTENTEGTEKTALLDSIARTGKEAISRQPSAISFQAVPAASSRPSVAPAAGGSFGLSRRRSNAWPHSGQRGSVWPRRL